MKVTALGMFTAVFLGLLPFVTSNQLFYGAVNAKFFFVIFAVDALALILAYGLYKGKNQISSRGRWFLGALLLMLGTQYVASVLGVFFERSLWSDIFWSSGVFFLTHIAVLAWLCSELFSERDWMLARRAVIVSAGVFSLLLILGVQGFGLAGTFLWVNLGERSLTLGNETYAGAYLLLAFILGLIELFRMEQWSKMRVIVVVSVVLTALSPYFVNFGILLGNVPLSAIIENPASILGLARASSAGLFFLIALLAGYFIFKRFVPSPWGMRLTVVWGGILTLVVAGAIGLLFTPGSSIQEKYIEQSSAARIIVWEVSANAISDRPFFGWGPENFNYALERHFDPRLFLNENLGEIWFERAHNVFVDTLVGSGVVGVLSFSLLTFLYFTVVYRARRQGHIGDTEAVLLCALVPVHVLQMQTGFDTIGSYTLLAVAGGYVLWLERTMSTTVPRRGQSELFKKVGAGVLVAGVLISGALVLAEYNRQTMLVLVFQAKTIEEQHVRLDASLARVSSFESLRLSSGSFIKGSLATIAEKSTPERTSRILEVTHLYETYYERYLEVQPHHYRARMNYAYLLLIMTTLGENRIEDAKQVITDSYVLSPGNPLTYILDALAELYRGNLVESDRLMAEALAINPDIEFTQEAAAYFKRQKDIFPNLTVLRLTNL